MGADSIKINTDSQLLCRQINGIYKIKNANLMQLYNQVLLLSSAFKKMTIEHIRRDKNTGADKLANKAVKEARKKPVL